MVNVMIRLDDLVKEGAGNVVFGEKCQNFSLLSAMEWFCRQHPIEVAATGLDEATNTLSAWMNEKRGLDFWCPGLDARISLPGISRKQLVHFAANMGKHSLLRLGA